MVTTERDAPSAAAKTPRLAARARERPAAAVLRLAARSDMVALANVEMEEGDDGQKSVGRIGRGISGELAPSCVALRDVIRHKSATSR